MHTQPVCAKLRALENHLHPKRILLCIHVTGHSCLMLVFLAFLLPATCATCHPNNLQALRGFTRNLSCGGFLLRALLYGASCCSWVGVGCDSSYRVLCQGTASPRARPCGPHPKNLHHGPRVVGGALSRLPLFHRCPLNRGLGPRWPAEALSHTSNNLATQLSSQLRELKNLSLLDLSVNRFSGRLPEVFDDLMLQEHLAVHSNGFS